MTDQQAQSRRTTSRFLLLMVVGGFVIISVMLVMRWFSREQLYVSSSVKRQTISYDDWYAMTYPSADGDMAYLEKFDFEAIDDEMAQKDPLSEQGQFIGKTPLNVVGGQWRELSFGGKIRLDSLAVTSGIPDEKGLQTTSVYALPYEKGQDSLESFVNTRTAFPFRSFAVHLETDQVVNSAVDHVQLMDLETDWLINQSFSFHAVSGAEISGNEMLVDIAAPFTNPVEFSFDLYYGEKVILDIPFKDGEIFNMNGVWTGLLFEPVGRSSFGDEMDTLAILKKQKDFPVRIDSIMANTTKGKVDGLLFDDKGDWIEFQISAQVSEIKSLQISILPFQDRITYTLDPLPGIYADHTPYEDLLDIPIDYIKFNNESEMEHWLCESLQLRMAFSSGSQVFPAGYFPVTFENKSVKDVFDDYKNHFPKQAEFLIEEEKGFLEIRNKKKQGWLESVLEKVF
jgi:hypothetical protein